MSQAENTEFPLPTLRQGLGHLQMSLPLLSCRGKLRQFSSPQETSVEGGCETQFLGLEAIVCNRTHTGPSKVVAVSVLLQGDIIFLHLGLLLAEVPSSTSQVLVSIT